MFEAYRIRPVLEWEGNDESRQLEAFVTFNEATGARSRLLCADPHADFEPRIFWTLYGVNPEHQGVRTEDAIADVDSENAALILLEKLIGRHHADPRAAAQGYYIAARTYSLPAEPEQDVPVAVALTLRVSLNLLRQQKRALVNLSPSSPVTPDQEEAVEGILNLLDFIQDSIFEQGLAAEDEIFYTGLSRDAS